MRHPSAFTPPTACASLYTGTVMHARMKPVVHRFTYRVFSLLIDLGQLDALDRASSVFSVTRWNLLSFSERDHGARDGSPLRAHVDGLLAKAGCDIAGGRVLLWCYPRVLGFVFNPLAIYYCYDAGGELAALVYEVRNTFGETHSYVAPIEGGERGPEGLRQDRDKLFYVSPFLDMTMRYRFRLLPPGERLNVRILETDADGPILAATFAGTRSDVTTRNLLGAFLRIPLLTFKIVAAIHWEALRLWIKGLRLRKRPAPPAPASYRVPRDTAIPEARP
ncbi:MAG: hypothetical protein JWM36_2171 [Hyphomicrobiales bacterium]|nr:hypothetical protein [Hyphomicrobiales bacterium]